MTLKGALEGFRERPIDHCYRDCDVNERTGVLYLKVHSLATATVDADKKIASLTLVLVSNKTHSFYRNKI